MNTTRRTVEQVAATIPVTLSEAKEYLRLYGTIQDALVSRLLLVATKAIEDRAGIVTIQRTEAFYLPVFPGNWWLFPVSPVLNISKIEYYPDDGGPLVEVSNLIYRLQPFEYESRLELVDDQDWPSNPFNRLDAVKITAVVGYGAAPSDVPEDIRHAIFMLVSYWFEFRDGVGNVPSAIDSLVRQFKRYRA